MKVISDDEIINNLLACKYDIKQLETKFIIYCINLICIQIQTFEMMFNGNDMKEVVSYTNGNQFKNNENDLLEIGYTAKLLS